MTPSNYTARAGSIKVTFHPEYLTTLASGEHVIGIVTSVNTKYFNLTAMSACEHDATPIITEDPATGVTTVKCPSCNCITERIQPTEFSVTPENRSKVGYTGVAGEVLEIPAVFKDGGTWYKVTSLGSYAFRNCTGLTSITIPNSVTSISTKAFANCISLASITIPNSVTSISNYVFYGCTDLTSITIPASVASIGDSAFSRCSNLASITVGAGNAKYDSRDNCNAIIETATNKLLVGCNTTVIPASVTSIGSYAFYGRSTLTSISIPTSVTAIGDSTFFECTGLAVINYTGTEEGWDSIVKGTDWNSEVPAESVINFNYAAAA